MKLLSLLPTIGLLLIAIILVSVVLACTPSKTVGNQQEEMQHDRHHEADAGNVVHRSIELSSDGYKAMSDLANGIQNRGIGECLILNIDGFNYHGEEQVAIHIFLNKKDADSTTSKKSEHFVASFIAGHKHGEESQNYTFGMDGAVEALGESLLADLDKGIIDISLVAYPAFGNPEVIENVKFTVDSISLEVNCE